MKLKTKSGFECDIPKGLTKDFRFLRARMELKSDDPDTANQAALDLVPIVFCDKKEEERFLLHLADEHGRVPLENVFQEIGEILTLSREADKQIKNS